MWKALSRKYKDRHNKIPLSGSSPVKLKEWIHDEALTFLAEVPIDRDQMCNMSSVTKTRVLPELIKEGNKKRKLSVADKSAAEPSAKRKKISLPEKRTTEPASVKRKMSVAEKSAAEPPAKRKKISLKSGAVYTEHVEVISFGCEKFVNHDHDYEGISVNETSFVIEEASEEQQNLSVYAEEGGAGQSDAEEQNEYDKDYSHEKEDDYTLQFNSDDDERNIELFEDIVENGDEDRLNGPVLGIVAKTSAKAGKSCDYRKKKQLTTGRSFMNGSEISSSSSSNKHEIMKGAKDVLAELLSVHTPPQIEPIIDNLTFQFGKIHPDDRDAFASRIGNMIDTILNTPEAIESKQKPRK